MVAMTNDDTLVEVYSPANRLQAALLSEMLEDAGIVHRVVNYKIADIAGDVPFTKNRPVPFTKNRPKVWVAAADHEAAAEICREFEDRITRRRREVTVTQGALFCYHCGETVGEQAEICPACGGRLE
jgi:hypothetical protein